MKHLKSQIIACLDKKISCYKHLTESSEINGHSIIKEIIANEVIQLTAVVKIFDTEQFVIKEEGLSEITRLTETLTAIDTKDFEDKEILKCAMQSEKLHFRLFSLIAKHSPNLLTATIFENFAKELASHSLKMEEIIEVNNL